MSLACGFRFVRSLIRPPVGDAALALELQEERGADELDGLPWAPADPRPGA
jgi:hypothetical protein